MTRYEDLAERLEAIGAELDELSFDLLQQAVADGATERPAADRTLTQARRAVEKAAGLLRQLEGLIQRRVCGPDGAQQTLRCTQTLGCLGDERVDEVDQGAEIAVAVLGEGEADAGELDVVVVAALDVERGRGLDRAAGDEMAEPLVELGELLRRRLVLQAQDQEVADVADRVVVGVEPVDLGRPPPRRSR